MPELASREHLRNLYRWHAKRGQANVTPQQLDAVAATRGPGHWPLLVGLRAAQGMAFALAKPFVEFPSRYLYSWIGGDPLSLL